MKLIIVAGVPGTGKTVIGSWLARTLGCNFNTLSWLVLEKGLWQGYDRVRRSFIVDYDVVKEEIKKVVVGSKNCLVFETHWLEPFEEVKSYVDYILLVRCNPLHLYYRLERRGWPRRKIVENVEAELVGSLIQELDAFKGTDIGELDTSRVSVDKARREALDLVRRRVKRCCVDWLRALTEKELEELLSLLERG